MSSPPPSFPEPPERWTQGSFFPPINGGARPVYPPPVLRPKRKLWLHVLLFVLTVASTTVMVGPLYSVAVMTILTAHEFGHYFAARHYRVPASLPYFIPFPSLFGTLGAVIRMSPYIPNRRILFDIAAAGPIAGLVVAVPISVIGILLSERTSQLPSGGITLGEPLLFRALEWLILGARAENTDLLLHPFAYAGWVGLFITALNLLPISQLDGGHINHALFGRKSKKIATVAFIALLATTLTQGFHYSVMLILIWLVGISHPPTINDHLPLDPRRRRLGWLLAIIFVLCFTPAPLEM